MPNYFTVFHAFPCSVVAGIRPFRRFGLPLGCTLAAMLKYNKIFLENSKKDIHLFLTFVETAETVCRGKSAAVLKG